MSVHAALSRNTGSIYEKETLQTLCLSSGAGCSCMSGALQNKPKSCRKCGPPSVGQRLLDSLLAAATHLKTPHVSRVPCVLQAVLVTLEEELEEEPVYAEEERQRENK